MSALTADQIRRLTGFAQTEAFDLAEAELLENSFLDWRGRLGEILDEATPFVDSPARVVLEAGAPAALVLEASSTFVQLVRVALVETFEGEARRQAARRRGLEELAALPRLGAIPLERRRTVDDLTEALGRLLTPRDVEHYERCARESAAEARAVAEKHARTLGAVASRDWPAPRWVCRREVSWIRVAEQAAREAEARARLDPWVRLVRASAVLGVGSASAAELLLDAELLEVWNRSGSTGHLEALSHLLESLPWSHLPEPVVERLRLAPLIGWEVACRHHSENEEPMTLGQAEALVDALSPPESARSLASVEALAISAELCRIAADNGGE